MKKKKKKEKSQTMSSEKSNSHTSNNSSWEKKAIEDSERFGKVHSLERDEVSTIKEAYKHFYKEETAFTKAEKKINDATASGKDPSVEALQNFEKRKESMNAARKTVVSVKMKAMKDARARERAKHDNISKKTTSPHRSPSSQITPEQEKALVDAVASVEKKEQELVIARQKAESDKAEKEKKDREAEEKKASEDIAVQREIAEKAEADKAMEDKRAEEAKIKHKMAEHKASKKQAVEKVSEASKTSTVAAVKAMKVMQEAYRAGKVFERISKESVEKAYDIAMQAYDLAESYYRTEIVSYDEALKKGDIKATAETAQQVLVAVHSTESARNQLVNLHAVFKYPKFEKYVNNVKRDVYQNTVDAVQNYGNALEKVLPVTKLEFEDVEKMSTLQKTEVKAAYNEKIKRAIVSLLHHGGYFVTEKFLPQHKFKTPIKLYLYRNSQPSAINTERLSNAPKKYRVFQEIYNTNFTPTEIKNLSNQLMCDGTSKNNEGKSDELEYLDFYKNHCYNQVNTRVYNVGDEVANKWYSSELNKDAAFVKVVCQHDFFSNKNLLLDVNRFNRFFLSDVLNKAKEKGIEELHLVDLSCSVFLQGTVWGYTTVVSSVDHMNLWDKIKMGGKTVKSR
jgi:hypothetical protein